ncbi:hypothetical protein JTE90_022436 [Oedothorax gibbosus]|uniref:Uncharacterized protein n=1 Tax=Oedothorax gibbosus TaxID=931172 RepID=A0AAV6TRB1_9ARAC|nr:hypothetical protein JTE90_022436 [Oedothorax gibbosus]
MSESERILSPNEQVQSTANGPPLVTRSLKQYFFLRELRELPAGLTVTSPVVPSPWNTSKSGGSPAKGIAVPPGGCSCSVPD